MTYRKKLIEVALPLEAINCESAREKAIRHGHPSTLHLWWARRPLAACRAVLFASIVDDPSSRPEEFPTEEAQEAERQRLFRIIEELVKWENSTNETVLKAARAEIMKSTDGNPPPVLDPFCGGGSIPLEAQRLGLEAHASDLNPIAVLITKALIEIPPKFSGKPPVNPEARGKLGHGGTWMGAHGLAEDVRYYGKWMRDEASRQIGHLYPNAKLPDGSEATVIAWIWARTARCPNPACGREMPLVNGWDVAKRKGKEASFTPVDRGALDPPFVVQQGRSELSGTVNRRGATCVWCGGTASLDYIRAEGTARRMGARLACIAAAGNRTRIYLDPTAEQEAASRVERPEGIPEAALSTHPQYMGTPRYGLTTFADLFTDRQHTTLQTFAKLVGVARDQVVVDTGDAEYGDAIATYLGLWLGRIANRSSSQSFWDPGAGKVQQVFARQALPMIWVYAEANPFSVSSGNALGQLEYLAKALETTPAGPAGYAKQRDAVALTTNERLLVSTDPPYYDNVPYADLSDFFYVLLRPALFAVEPDLFSTLLTPKTQELVADVQRFGGRQQARRHFESGMAKVLTELALLQDDRFPLTLFYAFKQTESAGTDGVASTGWETFLEAVLGAGFSVDGTWPMRTEQEGGLRDHGRNSLASSIVLVCRRRSVDAPITTRRDFVDELRTQLPEALHALQHGNVAPVDLAQASIGPGMAVFSRFGKVVEADGSPMSVRTALALINQALDEILAQQEGDFDGDTRFAIAWFEEHGHEEGPFGKAETLSKAKNVSISGLVEAGIVQTRAPKVWLLPRDQLDVAWDPASDRRLTVWEVTQHLVGRLEERGEGAAAELLQRVGGLGEIARELAYRLYTICERKGWAQEALGYNSLVVSWPEIARLASEPQTGQAQQALGV